MKVKPNNEVDQLNRFRFVWVFVGLLVLLFNFSSIWAVESLFAVS
jgi:hypothetical protein